MTPLAHDLLAVGGGSATQRYKRTDPANIVLREDLAVDRVIIGDKPFYKNTEIL